MGRGNRQCGRRRESPAAARVQVFGQVPERRQGSAPRQRAQGAHPARGHRADRDPGQPPVRAGRHPAHPALPGRPGGAAACDPARA